MFYYQEVNINCNYKQSNFIYFFFLLNINLYSDSFTLTSASVNFTTAKAPSSGRLIVTPSIGMILQTTFVFETFEWIIEEGDSLTFR